MKRPATRQRGVALLAFVTIFTMAMAGWMVTRLNASTLDYTMAKRARNAAVLQQAKQALIGHIALQAAKTGENDPGRLPCPENGSQAGTALEGANGTCTGATVIGRLPWRTIGMDKPVDADGEALWYVVSTGWVKPSSGTNLVINPDSTGALDVDSVPNAAVALIIAPGGTLSGQTRTATGVAYVNYLESYNAGTGKFITESSGSYNDQVVLVTVADIMPALEAAIAPRIELEISPVLSEVFTAANWGLTGRERMFPFAARFDAAAPPSSAYQGDAGRLQGLLPFNYGEACGSSPRCLLMAYSPTSVPTGYKVSGFGTIQTQSCNWDSTDTSAVLCTGEYLEDSGTPSGSMRIGMTATITNVANGFRTLDARIEARDDSLLGPWQVLSPTVATTMNANGSATVTFSATLPNIDAMGWGTYANFRIRLNVVDHRILATQPRELDFDGGQEEIRPGQTVVGATSGATGRVSAVVTSAGSWGHATPASQARGTLTFYSVSGSFRDNESLRVGGTTYATADGSDGAADDSFSWFARNEWFRHVYYAVASGYAWTGAGTCSDTSPVTCLQVDNLLTPAHGPKQRAVLISMGRRLESQVRPSTTLSNYLETTENLNGDTIFTQPTVGRSNNDRFITLSRNP